MNREEILKLIDRAEMGGWSSLDLSGRAIIELPSEIGRLTNLLSLNLAGNNLTKLPPEIGDLRKLTFLDLDSQVRQRSKHDLYGGRLLSTIIYPGGQSFGNNQILKLPPEIGLLDELINLSLEGNPLIFPPPEIVEQGTSAIVTYLRQQVKESQRLWRSKLLFVGEGGVGKTSLLQALLGKSFSPQVSSTSGIEVCELEFFHPQRPEIALHLSSWDFGGQEIYHATHQFFLTNRSLFILAWNARSGWEQCNLHRWLDVIHSRAPESPIIVVATHIDERDADLPTQELQKAYPQITAFCTVSNKRGTGIPELRYRVAKVAASLPLMGESWPRTWLDAATTIREQTDKHITPQRLFDLMADHDVLGEDAHILARWLHELGDILYYEEFENLKDLIILKPQWVTQHISDVLKSEDVIGRLGIFTRDHMKTLWSELSAGLRDHFLRLMEQFDLSYRIPENRDISLIVERLPLDAPAYQSVWNAILERQPCQEMTMIFQLNTIPPGVPTWFIARQHRFTTYTHWRNGVLFAQDNRDPHQARHLALVTATTYERVVTLKVRGSHPHNFFALLKDGLELTLARFPGLKIERLVPCPTTECSHLFDYEDLQRRLLYKPQIECPKCWQDISVPQLLFGIDWRTQDAVLERLDVLVSSQQQLVREQQELKELTDREFLALFKREQRLIESHCPNVFLLYPLKAQWYRRPLIQQKFALHLCCQAPNAWHDTRLGDDLTGYYEFEVMADWLVKMAPYLKTLFRLIQLATPFFHTSFNITRADMEQEWGHHVDLMHDLLVHLSGIDQKGFDEMPGLVGKSEVPSDIPQFDASGAALRQIRGLLEEKDPDREWGGLRKILTPEGHFLWLCELHAEQYRT